MVHVPAKFRENTSMRFRVSAKTKRDGQTDETTLGWIHSVKLHHKNGVPKNVLHPQSILSSVRTDRRMGGALHHPVPGLRRHGRLLFFIIKFGVQHIPVSSLSESSSPSSPPAPPTSSSSSSWPSTVYVYILRRRRTRTWRSFFILDIYIYTVKPLIMPTVKIFLHLLVIWYNGPHESVLWTEVPLIRGWPEERFYCIYKHL